MPQKGGKTSRRPVKGADVSHQYRIVFAVPTHPSFPADAYSNIKLQEVKVLLRLYEGMPQTTYLPNVGHNQNNDWLELFDLFSMALPGRSDLNRIQHSRAHRPRGAEARSAAQKLFLLRDVGTNNLCPDNRIRIRLPSELPRNPVLAKET